MDISTDYPIGSRLTLEVIEGDCRDCFFANLDYDRYIDCCQKIKCSNLERRDCKSIIFKLSDSTR